MVEDDIEREGISNKAVLQAMRNVPRHLFVIPEHRPKAYYDQALPIGHKQTITPPYLVAYMTELLDPQPSDRVLEIGTGCGYQAAILASLGREVFTVECRAELATSAAERLARLGYANVHVHCGDGTLGLPEFAPFDAILVAAAAPAPPAPLIAQLADGGRMVIPVGSVESQELQLIARLDDKTNIIMLEPCRFVPLVGAHGWKESPPR
jgi:protein-L-isoaspartate(D-aspartate) O-methyltransferase